jgi:acetolactate synthase-1/2/3 large subunit
VELIIAVGTSLGEISTGGWDKAVLNNRLVHISATEDDFVRSPMARLHALGDARAIFSNLLKDLLITNMNRGAPLREVHKVITLSNDEHKNYHLPRAVTILREEHLFSNVVPLKPQRVMHELVKRLPPNTRFIVDAGNAWAWTTHYLMLESSNLQRTAFGFGAMGWAIGAAIGTALGCRKEVVVCITGDGSYLMSGQEISVAVAEQLPMLFIVLNDQALGMVKHGQRLSGAEAIGYELPPVDFAQIARAQGAQAHTIRIPEDFQQIDVEQILTANGPTLLDIHIDPEEVPPMGARVKTLSGIN